MNHLIFMLLFLFLGLAQGSSLTAEQKVLVQSAEAYMKKDQYQKALVQLQKARTLNQAEVSIDEKIRECHIRLGNWISPEDAALSGWIETDKLRLQEVQPKAYDSLLRVGKTLESRENYETAERIFSFLAGKEPSNKSYGKAFQDLRLKIEIQAQNHMEVGEVFLKQGRFSKALDEFKAALFFRPKDPYLIDRIKLVEIRQVELRGTYRKRLSKVLAEGDRDQAAVVAERAFREFPDEMYFRRTLDSLTTVRLDALSKLLDQARSMVDASKGSEAIPMLREALVTFPGEVQVLDLLQQAQVQAEAQKRKIWLDSLRTEVDRALEQGNLSLAGSLLQNLKSGGATSAETEKQEKVLIEQKNRAQSQREFEAILEKARKSMKDGNLKESRKDLESALAMNPQSPVAKQMFLDVQKEEAKLAEIEESKRKDVQKAESFVKSGQIQSAKKVDLSLTGAKEVDQEVKQVQRAIREAEYARTPENDKKAQELFFEGIGSYRLGDYQEAFEKWNQVLKLNPDHEQAKKYVINVKQKLARMK